MKALIISDIHGNIEALNTVLEEDFDVLVCLGDMVNYGANPNECLESISCCPHIVISGNHDRAVYIKEEREKFPLSIQKIIEWTSANLSPQNMYALTNLPSYMPHLDFELAHASIIDPIKGDMNQDYIKRLSFSAMRKNVALIGHTHIPTLWTENECRIMKDGDEVNLLELSDSGKKVMLNPGSVGRPKDGNNKLSFIIIEDGKAVWKRKSYDIESSQNAIIDSGLPEWSAECLETGTQPSF